MTVAESIRGKPAYAGGSSSVNIRENVTVNSAVIGNVAVGGVMGTATGNIFPDLDHGALRWYELTLPDGRRGYVREDVVRFTAGHQNSHQPPEGGLSLAGEFIKPPSGVWGLIAICLVLLGISVWVLVKKRKYKK